MRAMAYDEDVANRLREELAGEDFTEKRMFGGLAFLVAGHMAIAASRTGGLLVRVDPAAAEAALQQPHAARMVMRGREMDGWLTVAPDAVADGDAIGGWAATALAYVRTLPPKD
jgi:phage terminase large subunit-like protein